MRALAVVEAADPRRMSELLRRALVGEGPAILPREPVAATVLGDREIVAHSPVPAEVPKAVALVVETSGSSGSPKRVALSAEALLASAAGSESALGGPGQWLLALPTHYVAGVQVLVRSIAAGTAPVLHPPGHFDPARFARLAAELDAPLRFTSLVPVQLARLLAAAEADPSLLPALRRFDALLIGGQALAAPLRERALEAGLRIVRTYGASETAGGCVYDGQPIGRMTARLTEGELELAGPSLAECYLGDEELTAARFHTDSGVRWYRTTDAGVIDAEGRVGVTGRLDNVIISGGVKVSLDRVERLVQSVPGFEQAIVAARDSELWGQESIVIAERRPLESAVAARAWASSDTASPTSWASGAPASATPTADAPTVGGQAGSAPGDPTSAATGGGRRTGEAALREAALAAVRRVVIREAGRAAAPGAVVVLERMPRLSSGKPDRLSAASGLRAGAR